MFLVYCNHITKQQKHHHQQQQHRQRMFILLLIPLLLLLLLLKIITCTFVQEQHQQQLVVVGGVQAWTATNTIYNHVNTNCKCSNCQQLHTQSFHSMITSQHHVLSTTTTTSRILFLSNWIIRNNKSTFYSTTTTVRSSSTSSANIEHEQLQVHDVDKQVSQQHEVQEQEQQKQIFENFVQFLIQQQSNIIQNIESTIEATTTTTSSSTSKFTYEPWGIYATMNNTGTSTTTAASGGITRIIQNGTAIEKGACSITVIRNGTLSKERASAILGRQQQQQVQDATKSLINDDTTNNIHNINNNIISVKEGDIYSAVALSMVLHSRNPMVPTFRSDVRMFQVQTTTTTTTPTPTTNYNNSSNHPTTTTMITWVGGGADLTPYYLYKDDIQYFHTLYNTLCNTYQQQQQEQQSLSLSSNLLSYTTMKDACDQYFYLPARQEHRGTGGIFFDDIPIGTPSTSTISSTNNYNNNSSSTNNYSTPVLDFCYEMTSITWMKSYIPIVLRRMHLPYTNHEKYFQKLRRGRYLEFNLLYDRGVKFGLQTSNPRVEGIMISAPPEIVYEYKYIPQDEREIELIQILKEPISWI